MGQISTWLAAGYEQMLELLEALVNQDSGSYDKLGVDAAGVILQRFFETHGVACERISLSQQGDCFRAFVPGRTVGRPIMLLGYRDTVFPKGEAARRPFHIEDGRAHGPGVADKGGISVNTVAPNATCDIDLRYERLEERDRLIAAIATISERADVEGMIPTIRILGEFMPMAQSPGSKVLYENYIKAARSLGLEIGGSCADSGLTAAVGTPTLCAVGPVGGKAHSPEEYFELSSFVPRAQALALTVAALTAD